MIACKRSLSKTHHHCRVVWDNRCVLHRACPFDHAEPRVLKGTRIAGDVESELYDGVQLIADRDLEASELVMAQVRARVEAERGVQLGTQYRLAQEQQHQSSKL